MIDLERFKGTKPSRFIWLLRLLRKLIPPASPQERIYRWFVFKVKYTLDRLQNAWPGIAEMRYARWQAMNEANIDISKESSWDQELPEDTPLISIILLPAEHELSVIQYSIDSVLAQTHQKWELWVYLQDAIAQTGPQLFACLPNDDERIHVEFSYESADGFPDLLKPTSGEYILLITQEDLLAPQALEEIALAASQESNADVIYTDQDTYDTVRKRRVHPWFKPNWSPEMMLSVNYLRPLIVRKSLLAEVIEEDFGRNINWWDLALRCVENAREIFHIPKILFHTVNSSRLEQSSISHGKNAVTSHLARSGLENVRVFESGSGSNQAVWPSRGDMVSIVIPTRDHPEMLRKCVRGILHRTSYSNLQIIVVDNASINEKTKEYYNQIQTDERVKIIQYDEPFNYSEANNLGVKHADGQHLLFLNDDVEVLDENWLEEMVRWSERDEIGAVGAKLLFPNGMIQHAGIVLGLGGHAGHVFRGVREVVSGPFGSTEWYRNYLAVTAACLMVPREVFQEIEGFNVKFQLAFGDVDLCLRIRQLGYRVLYTPFARLMHHESVSRGRHIPTSDLIEGYEQFATYIQEGDPHFNPNLSYRTLSPSVKMEPEDRLQFLGQILTRRVALENWDWLES